MRAQSVDVFVVPTTGPGDVSGVLALIQSGRLDPELIVAILGKTEGNGGVNDFTREFAGAALCNALAQLMKLTTEAVAERIALVMSGGTEGVLSPHLTVFARRTIETQSAAAGGKRLSIGIAQTRDFLAEEIGRKAQIDETAKAVRAAMTDAGIDNAANVHFVQIKCPLLTAERVEAAQARGQKTATISSYGSMAYSRGASALGVALELGEIAAARDEDVLKNWSLYSTVASTSAGIELMHNVVIVMGNSATATSPYVIGHAVMQDAIDLGAVAEALASVGIKAEDGSRKGLLNVLAKAEASPDGTVRGFRHTMLDDSDINATRHARAAVGGLIAGVAGTSLIYVSGGAEHQGPPGGGPVAVIARV